MKPEKFSIPDSVINFQNAEIPSNAYEMNEKDLRFSRTLLRLIQKGGKDVSSKNLKKWIDEMYSIKELGERYIIWLLKINHTLDI